MLHGNLMKNALPEKTLKAQIDFVVMRKVSDEIAYTRNFQTQLVNKLVELMGANMSTYLTIPFLFFIFLT